MERKTKPALLRSPAPPAIELQDAPAPNRSGLSGTGAVSDAPLRSARRGDAVGPPSLLRADGVGDLSTPRSGSVQDGDRPVPWLLPRMLILWIRENRELIVGGALLAGAIWLTLGALSVTASPIGVCLAAPAA